MPTATPAELEEQRNHLASLIATILKLAKNLPETVPLTWERVFLGVSDSELEKRITRRPYGLDRVGRYTKTFMNFDGMENHNGYQLMAGKAAALISFVEKMYVSRSSLNILYAILLFTGPLRLQHHPQHSMADNQPHQRPHLPRLRHQQPKPQNLRQ